MKLSTNFSLQEFTDSDTAARRGIDNSVPQELLPNAVKTAEMLERIRALLSSTKGQTCRIRITSGYRSPHLNYLIGSGVRSDHPKALAADIKSPDFGTPYDVAALLAKHIDELQIGQLILEYSWVHVAVPVPDKVIDRILTISRPGAAPIPGIVKV